MQEQTFKHTQKFKDELHKRNYKSFLTFFAGASSICGIIFFLGLIFPHFTEFRVEYGMFCLYSLCVYVIGKLVLNNYIQHIELAFYLAVIPIMIGAILLSTFIIPQQSILAMWFFICLLTLFITDKLKHIIIFIMVNSIIFIFCICITNETLLYNADKFNIIAYTALAFAINYFSLRDRIRSIEDYCLLQIEAETDSLTKVFNRKMGEIKVQQLLNAQKTGTFIMIDIDNFKYINDTYGHHIGDEVLCEISRILMDVFAFDIIFRLGGDEFAVFVENLESPTECMYYTQKLVDLAKRVNTSNAECTNIGLSIGCVICKEKDTDFEQLYRQSDNVLYKAKHKGKNNYIITKFTN